MNLSRQFIVRPVATSNSKMAGINIAAVAKPYMASVTNAAAPYPAFRNATIT